MRRPALPALLALLVAAPGAGCQDYNFNPVGKCLLQPSTARVKLSELSSADVLFVVDESGSMGGEQQKLATNFQHFIQNLNAYNNTRVGNLLDPFDFHIAVTTTSVSWNRPLDATCRSDCGSSTGNLVCCRNTGGSPVPGPKHCSADAECGSTETCKTTCAGYLGTPICCDAGGVWRTEAPITCTSAGSACGSYSQHYAFGQQAGCAPGVAEDGWSYPAGDFVSLQGNPRVLHFDKELYAAGGTGKNRQGYTQTQLEQFFARDVGGGSFEGNVVVGTCGSGQEQALLAARSAVEKALAGQQKDTVDLAGNPTWNPTTRVAGSAAEWPHENAKLVVVIVGDEDDCSFPGGDAGPTGVVLTGGPGADSCVADASLPEAERKQIKVGDFVDYFLGLGRPLGAAFVVSAKPQPSTPGEPDICGREGFPPCTAGFCCDTDCTLNPNVCSNSTCGGQGKGIRLLEAAQGLKGQGADVISGSICDPDFGQLLDEIANVVRPPSGLILPTEPAESVVTLLRIADKDGQTRKICRGPAPAGITAAQARADGWDWWFTPTRDPGDPISVSSFVYINPDGDCRANPGETYSADYIGLLPPNGCQSRDECRATLGGRFEDWGCYTPPGASRGTCICCASGSTDPACQ